MFLFSGAALLAVVVTRLMGRWGLGIGDWRLGVADRGLQKPGCSAQKPEVGGQRPEGRAPWFSLPLKFEIWHLVFGISLVAILFDVSLFHWLNDLALRTPLVDVPVQFLMNDYIVPTALVLTLLALWFAGRDADERANFQRTVLHALVALALASITLKLINEVYFRPRPFTFDDSVRLLFYHPSDSSMPSNAATVGFALAVAVWLCQKRWGTVMLALSAGMTFARIVGGVHYPADVVVGAWLGGVWAWLVNRAPWLDSPLDRVSGLARRMGLG